VGFLGDSLLFVEKDFLQEKEVFVDFLFKEKIY
jgi:hypothetical protein